MDSAEEFLTMALIFLISYLNGAELITSARMDVLTVNSAMTRLLDRLAGFFASSDFVRRRGRRTGAARSDPDRLRRDVAAPQRFEPERSARKNRTVIGVHLLGWFQLFVCIILFRNRFALRSAVGRSLKYCPMFPATSAIARSGS